VELNVYFNEEKCGSGSQLAPVISKTLMEKHATCCLQHNQL